MDAAPTASPSDETGSLPGRVTLRYWASARAAAGRAEEQYDATTVADVLDQARRAHRDNHRFVQVLGVSSLLLADRPIGSRDPETVPVADGDVVEVLPPFAGG
jgi:molybdopterin synthase sulfur carrier subunit